MTIFIIRFIDKHQKNSAIQLLEIFLASSQYGQGKTSECNKQIPRDLICVD